MPTGPTPKQQRGETERRHTDHGPKKPHSWAGPLDPPGRRRGDGPDQKVEAQEQECWDQARGLVLKARKAADGDRSSHQRRFHRLVRIVIRWGRYDATWTDVCLFFCQPPRVTPAGDASPTTSCSAKSVIVRSRASGNTASSLVDFLGVGPRSANPRPFRPSPDP